MPTLEKIVSPVIRGIHASYKGRVVCRAMLTSMAREIGSLPEVRRLCCRFEERGRYPERPMITLHEEHPSVYLLGWREGDFTDVHDHGACEVGIYVMQGVITEDVYVCTPLRGGDKRIALNLSRNLRQGDMMTCPQQYIHAVGNIFPEVAATLHVYGPALSEMNTYEVAGSLLRFKGHWEAEHEEAHH